MAGMMENLQWKAGLRLVLFHPPEGMQAFLPGQIAAVESCRSGLRPKDQIVGIQSRPAVSGYVQGWIVSF